MVDSVHTRVPDFRYVVRRRTEAGLPAPPQSATDLWGLALSGGGIRSATFCFGLLRGLAQGRSLKHFDYLSTVSGGGYIGSALGRLYGPEQDANVVQDRLAGSGTILLWWLRNNGRYLTPSGTRDLIQALASIFRNMLFSIVEAGLLVLLLAGLMLVPYVFMAVLDLNPGGDPRAGWPTHAHARFFSLWLYALLVPLLMGAHSIFAYWLARDRPTNQELALAVAGLGVLCAIGFGRAAADDLFRGTPYGAWHLTYFTIGAVLLTPATAWAMQFSGEPETPAAARLRHTKRLGACLAAVPLLALVAVVDWLSDSFAAWIAGKMSAGAMTQDTVAKGAAAVTALVAFVRTWLPKLQAWLKLALKEHPRLKLRTEQLINLAGLALLAVFVLLWATALQLWVNPSIQWKWWPEDGMFNPSVVHWLAIFGGAALFCWVTSQDVDALNLSSLHNYYRARLERAYVSTGNWAPPLAAGRARCRFPVPPLDPVARWATEQIAPLVEAAPRDDIPLRKYAPHLHGGPIHLMTCCVNQTVDDRTGLYNADRKGVALTVSSLGVETGAQMPLPFAELAKDGKPRPGEGKIQSRFRQIDEKVGMLSRWVAVSGAAAGSGMGSQTSPGLAALLFLCGVRLGFWTHNLLPARRQRGTVLSPKYRYLVSELLARFPGLASPYWYVSDGGHFENTAVYALLKRRLGLIVLADCGADPDFRFDDLQNLVRKARIDFGASIDFIAPADLARAGVATALVDRCGTMAHCAAFTDRQALLVARITYSCKGEGILVLVKPRRLADAPLEVADYAARHEKFPQQTTGDQFFDESQWEAYHQLGLFIGKWFDERTLQGLLVSLRPATNAAGAFS